MKVLDVGSGIGGPMRTIACASGAEITGITINGYQVKRAKHHNRKVYFSTCEMQHDEHGSHDVLQRKTVRSMQDYHRHSSKTGRRTSLSVSKVYYNFTGKALGRITP